MTISSKKSGFETHPGAKAKRDSPCEGAMNIVLPCCKRQRLQCEFPIILESQKTNNSPRKMLINCVYDQRTTDWIFFGSNENTKLNRPNPKAVPATMRSSTGPSGAMGAVSRGNVGVDAVDTQRERKPVLPVGVDGGLLADVAEDVVRADARERSESLCFRLSGSNGNMGAPCLAELGSKGSCGRP